MTSSTPSSTLLHITGAHTRPNASWISLVQCCSTCALYCLMLDTMLRARTYPQVVSLTPIAAISLSYRRWRGQQTKQVLVYSCVGDEYTLLVAHVVACKTCIHVLVLRMITGPAMGVCNHPNTCCPCCVVCCNNYWYVVYGYCYMGTAYTHGQVVGMSSTLYR